MSKPTSAQIDVHIRDLVVFMNESGLETVASCEGHLPQAKEPYVYFKTDVWIASGIAIALRHDLLSATPRLNFYWVIEGHFNPSGELLFRLSSPELQKKAFSICHLITTQRMRDRINSDLFVLQEIVQKALMADPVSNERPNNKCNHQYD